MIKLDVNPEKPNKFILYHKFSIHEFCPKIT